MSTFAIKKIAAPLFITVLLLFVSHGLSRAQDILVVQSVRIKPYDEVVRGFKSVCECNVKRLVISEMDTSEVIRIINNTQPDLILAVGMDALREVRKIKNIPIVYLMVLNTPPSLNDENITGVSMTIPPDKQLAEIAKAIPHIKKIGVIYNPSKTGHILKSARNTAAELGIEFAAVSVAGHKDVPEILNGMKGDIGAFWMLPDTSVLTPEIAEFLLLFSFENRIPIITFSEKYVEKGALLSLDVDPLDMGRQGGEMAAKILAGTPTGKIPPASPRNSILTINLKVAGKMGITINKDILNKSRIIK